MGECYLSIFMLRFKSFSLVLLTILVVALVAGCSSPASNTPTPSTDPNRVVKTGDNVFVDYIGTYTNGTVFDTSLQSVAQGAGIYSPARTYKPINFTVGSSQVIQGFDEAVIGMKLNDSRTVTIPPEKGYGNYDPTLIKAVPMSTFTDQNITPQVNQTIYDSYGRPLRIDSINATNNTVNVDFNSPMAGKTLQFVITLRGIQ